MDTKTRNAVVTLQNTLASIQAGKPVAFSIVQFKNKGLVRSIDHYGVNAYGQKVRIKTTYHLTDKAKQFLNVII